MHVSEFLTSSIKQVQALKNAPLTLELRPRGKASPKTSVKHITITPVSRCEGVLKVYEVLRSGGFEKLLKTHERGLKLNHPKIPDQTFLFQWEGEA